MNLFLEWSSFKGAEKHEDGEWKGNIYFDPEQSHDFQMQNLAESCINPK